MEQRFRHDDEMTLGELRRRTLEFSHSRGWLHEFEGRSLAAAIAIEAAELQEHFLWGDEMDRHPDRIAPEKKREIGHEVADILIYLMNFCNQMGIDMSEAVQDKMQINEKRFPAQGGSRE